MNELSDHLRKNLLEIVSGRDVSIKASKAGPLFFSVEDCAQGFVDLFGISQPRKFKEAFKIVTGGVGSEDTKINSLVSSSLLSLLTFYSLFEYQFGKSDCKIDIDDIGQFDSCLFEVRNQVIKFPSCVDILLKNKTQCLFWESKFNEPLRDITDRLELGIGYKDLYLNSDIKEILNSNGIFVVHNSKKLYLQTYENKGKPKEPPKKYLYGIKQAISHLIGLVRGPQIYKKYFPEYPKGYYSGWDEDTKLYFGTILYHVPSMNDVREYKELYEAIFCGEKGRKILSAIYDWVDYKYRGVKSYISKEKLDDVNLIRPLTYQEIFTKDKNKFLDERVARFYELGKYNENPSSL